MGQVRYLRPAYQAPTVVSAEQLSLNHELVMVPTAGREIAGWVWSLSLAQQMRGVCDVVEGAGAPVRAAEVALRFSGKVKAKQVQPLLESLAELALVRGMVGVQAYRRASKSVGQTYFSTGLNGDGANRRSARNRIAPHFLMLSHVEQGEGAGHGKQGVVNKRPFSGTTPTHEKAGA